VHVDSVTEKEQYHLHSILQSNPFNITLEEQSTLRDIKRS